jgi:hypothetical protein
MIQRLLLSALVGLFPLVGGSVEVSKPGNPITQEVPPTLMSFDPQELQRHQPYLQEQIRLEHEADAEAQWGAPH